MSLQVIFKVGFVRNVLDDNQECLAIPRSIGADNILTTLSWFSIVGLVLYFVVLLMCTQHFETQH